MENITRLIKNGESQIIEFKASFQKELIEFFNHGIAEPKFEEFAHGFRVILYKKKPKEKDVGVNVGINVGINELYDFIKENQPIRISHITKHFNQVTARTIERWIKKLKDEGKIEFRGSKKTGGYYAK